MRRARLRRARRIPRARRLQRPDFDGPGDWRWLCLDHVRAFNADYNYFEGMSADEISDAQNPYGGWDRETRAFATANGSPPAALGRFRRSARRDRRALPPRGPRARATGASSARPTAGICGCSASISTSTGAALRMRYAELVRRYHPDRNGGDRSHEKALQAVIEAYTALKGRPIFA